MPRLSRLRFMNVDRTRLPVRDRLRSRGVPNALQQHAVAETADPRQAHQVVSQLLGRSTITAQQPVREDLTCTLNAVQVLDVTMAHLDLGAPAELEVTCSPECYTVHMTTAGQAQVHVGERDHELSAFFALVVSPGMGYRLRLARDTPQLIIRIEREAVERTVARLIGRSPTTPVVFDPVGDLTTDAASRWTGALNILSAEVMSPDSLVRSGIGAGALEELVVSTLLYIQPSNYSSQFTSVVRRSGRVAVRRSIEYIEEHLAEPITLGDLVRHTRMSARSIQSGFRDDLGTTPISFVRERRLDQVRRTLISALPGDGMTVTEAAQRWGFTHLGSFSVVYRKRFGESPSQTLRS